MILGRVLTGLAAASLLLFAGVPVHARPNPHASLDCNYCHADTPRFGVDTRATVNFWRTEGDEPQLCERCHGPDANLHPLGVIPGSGQLGTRVPNRLPLGTSEAVRGQVVCISCHFVHAADADHALLRGFAGSDEPGIFDNWQDLCRQCHGETLEKRSPHAGDKRSCAFCHSMKPRPGQPAGVSPVGRQLCEFCHGFMAQDHYAGVNPFSVPKDCTGCHDPHLGKDSPGRLRAGYFDPIRDEVTLNPHRKRRVCFACHVEGKGAALRAADPVALCQRCHGSGKIAGMSHPLAKVPQGFSIPEGWPLASGALTCLTCHMPGHGPGAFSGRPDEADKPHLLRGGVAGERTAVCFRCHAKDQWKGMNPHLDAGAKKTGCTRCHAEDPESGDPDVFVADINILCLSCHEGADHPSGIKHTVTLMPGMPAVPKALPLGTGGRITCATCHNQHLATAAGHRLRGTEDQTAFCLRCHKV